MRPYEEKSTAELFTLLFKGEYEDADTLDHGPSEALRVLRHRNTDEVFERAALHVRSAAPLERSRALDVLAQLGAGRPVEERPHIDASVALAIDHLTKPDPEIVESAAYALGFLATEISQRTLLQVANHPDPAIRLAVARGLHGCDLPEAAPALMQLMEDADNEVRDWATFALGTRPEPDSPAIREALRKRLDDPYPDARHEGI